MQPSVPSWRLQEPLSSPTHPSVSNMFSTFTSPCCWMCSTSRKQTAVPLTSVRHSQPKFNDLMIFLFMSVKVKTAALISLVGLTFSLFTLVESLRGYLLCCTYVKLILLLYFHFTFVAFTLFSSQHIVNIISEQHTLTVFH